MLSFTYGLGDVTDTWGLEAECEEIRNAKLICATPESHGSRSRVSHRLQAKVITAQVEMAASWAVNEDCQFLEPLDLEHPAPTPRDAKKSSMIVFVHR